MRLPGRGIKEIVWERIHGEIRYPQVLMSSPHVLISNLKLFVLLIGFFVITFLF